MNVCMCGGLVPQFPFGAPFLNLSKSSYSDLFSYTYMYVQHTHGTFSARNQNDDFDDDC